MSTANRARVISADGFRMQEVEFESQALIIKLASHCAKLRQPSSELTLTVAPV